MSTWDKFDVYGALYMLCARHHSGQWSLGYRILSRLDAMGYRPGLTVSNGHEFETPEMREAYKHFYRKLHKAL